MRSKSWSCKSTLAVGTNALVLLFYRSRLSEYVQTGTIHNLCTSQKIITFATLHIDETPEIIEHLQTTTMETYNSPNYLLPIQFKIALITYKTLSTDQPPYLSSLLHPYRPSRSLRSANRNLLLIPPHTTNFSRRAFSFTAPTLWNQLPTCIRESNTLHTFKRRLKTHLTSPPS